MLQRLHVAYCKQYTRKVLIISVKLPTLVVKDDYRLAGQDLGIFRVCTARRPPPN